MKIGLEKFLAQNTLKISRPPIGVNPLMGCTITNNYQKY